MYFEGKCREIDSVAVVALGMDAEPENRYVCHGIGGVDWDVMGFVGDEKLAFGPLVVGLKNFSLVLQGPNEGLDLRQDGAVGIPLGAAIKRHDFGFSGGLLGFGADDWASAILDCNGQDFCDRDPFLNVLDGGLHGSVIEGSRDGEICFVVITGLLGDLAGHSQQDILDYLVKAFQVDVEMGFSLDETLLRAASKRLQEKRKEQTRNEEQDLDC